MATPELEGKIHELRELRRMAAELAAEIETIQDSIKEQMQAQGVDTVTGTDWKASYTAVTTTRLDTAALRKALPELAAQFTRTNTVRRFCLA